MGQPVKVHGRGTLTITKLISAPDEKAKTDEEWLAKLSDGATWWIGEPRSLTITENGSLSTPRMAWSGLRPLEEKE